MASPPVHPAPSANPFAPEPPNWPGEGKHSSSSLDILVPSAATTDQQGASHSLTSSIASDLSPLMGGRSFGRNPRKQVPQTASAHIGDSVHFPSSYASSSSSYFSPAGRDQHAPSALSFRHTANKDGGPKEPTFSSPTSNKKKKSNSLHRSTFANSKGLRPGRHPSHVSTSKSVRLPTLSDVYRFGLAELGLFFSSRLEDYFARLGAFHFDSAHAAVSAPMPLELEPKRRLYVVPEAGRKLVRQVSRKTNHGSALRMHREEFWYQFRSPLVLFLECERVYYSLYYVPRSDSDVLIQKYHLALERLQTIVDVLLDDEGGRGISERGNIVRDKTGAFSDDDVRKQPPSTRQALGHPPSFSLNGDGSQVDFNFGSFSSSTSSSSFSSSNVSSPSPSRRGIQQHIASKRSAMSPLKRQAYYVSGVDADASPPKPRPLSVNSFIHFVSDISKIIQTRCAMVTALKRLKLIGTSRSGNSVGALKPIPCKKWAKATRSLLKKPKSVSHPLLEGLREHTNNEVGIFSSCMAAQDAIENYQFSESVLSLHQVRHFLTRWRGRFAASTGAQYNGVKPSAGIKPPPATKSQSFLDPSRAPPLCHWFYLFYQALCTKSEIYFRNLIQGSYLRQRGKSCLAQASGTTPEGGFEGVMNAFEDIQSAAQKRGSCAVSVLLLATDEPGGELSSDREYSPEYGYSVAKSLQKLQAKRQSEQAQPIQPGKRTVKESSDESQRTQRRLDLLTSPLVSLLNERALQRKKQFQGIRSSPVIFTYPPSSPKDPAKHRLATKDQSCERTMNKEINTQSKTLHGSETDHVDNLNIENAAKLGQVNIPQKVDHLDCGDHETETMFAGTHSRGRIAVKETIIQARGVSKSDPVTFIQPHLPNVVAMSMMLRESSSSIAKGDDGFSGVVNAFKPFHIFSPAPNIQNSKPCSAQEVPVGSGVKIENATSSSRQAGNPRTSSDSNLLPSSQTSNTYGGRKEDVAHVVKEQARDNGKFISKPTTRMHTNRTSLADALPGDASKVETEFVLANGLHKNGDFRNGVSSHLVVENGTETQSHATWSDGRIGTHYYACRIDSRVTLVVVETLASNDADREKAASMVDEYDTYTTMPPRATKQYNNERHSDLPGLSSVKSSVYASMPSLRIRVESSPASFSSSRGSISPSGNSRSIWYSQSHGKHLTTANKRSSTSAKFPLATREADASILDSMARIRDVLQGKEVISKLGPLQATHSDVKRTSSGDPEEAGVRIAEKTRHDFERKGTTGCITC